MSQPVLQGWFSTSIRRNRKSYFLTIFPIMGLALVGMLIYFGIFFAVIASVSDSGTTDEPESLVASVFWFNAVAIVLFTGFFGILSMSLTAQRLRDMNWSGWWAVALFVFELVLGWLDAIGSLSGVALIAGTAGSVLLLIIFLLLLFIPGTKGPNRFGPDPLQIKKPAK